MENEKMEGYKRQVTMEIAVKLANLVNNFQKKNNVDLSVDNIMEAFESNMYSVLMTYFDNKKINDKQMLALVDKSYTRLLSALNFRVDLVKLMKKDEEDYKKGGKNGKRIN
jgi:hypothetical protein